MTTLDINERDDRCAPPTGLSTAEQGVSAIVTGARAIVEALPGEDCGARIDGHRRIGFGRFLDTDLLINGTLPVPLTLSPGWTEHDAIRIRRRPTVTAPIEDRPIWSRTGPNLCFAAPMIADYRCTEALIEVTPFAGTPNAAIEALLIATALPATLWLAGEFMIHAAAVVPHDWDADSALAIAGASCSGKSRLAAAFLACGATLVADDSIAVRCERGQVRCAGLAGGYHLATQDAIERTFHPVAAHRSRQSARLAAIVVLEDDPSIGRKRLQGVEAIEALLANRHRASVPRRCGLEPRALRDVAHLARTISIWRWPRHDADALLDDDIRRTIIQNDSMQDRETR